MRRLPIVAIMTLVLVGVLVMLARVEESMAWNGDFIYIREDGSIDPPTAPIQRSGNVYTLTSDIIAGDYGISVLRNNTVLDGGIYSLHGSGNVTDWGVYLSGYNITVRNMRISNCDRGVSISWYKYSEVVGNNITDNNHGVYIHQAWFNRIEQNNITSSRIGVYLSQCSDNSIVGNNIASNRVGVYHYADWDNRISGNNIVENELDGIYLSEDSKRNIIVGNTIRDNGQYGIDFWHIFEANIIYNNNFINNSQGQVFTSGPNIWNSNYPSGGNYWSGDNGLDIHGGPYQNETGSDGIRDTPYLIDSENADNYPLMGPFQNFTVSTSTTGFQPVEVLSNSTVSDLSLSIWLSSPHEGFQPGQSFIQFSAAGENGSVGFCRLMMPKTVLNTSSYSVLVDSHPVSATVLLISNSTHAYLYFTYAHSTHEVIVTIPEFSSFLVLPLFVIATLLAVIVYRRKNPAT